MLLLSSFLRAAFVIVCLLGAASGALLEEAEARERRGHITERPVCVAVQRNGRVRSRAPLLSGVRSVAAAAPRPLPCLRKRVPTVKRASRGVRRGDVRPAGFNVAWFVWRRVSSEPAASC